MPNSITVAAGDATPQYTMPPHTATKPVTPANMMRPEVNLAGSRSWTRSQPTPPIITAIDAAKNALARESPPADAIAADAPSAIAIASLQNARVRSISSERRASSGVAEVDMRVSPSYAVGRPRVDGSCWVG